MDLEHTICNVIKEKYEFPLMELKEKTGLNFHELFYLLGKLTADGKVTLSVRANAETDYAYQSRHEYLFHRFMDLTAKYLPQERNINFYASKLCITPKYLSYIVKQASGKTPTILIKEKVMDEIKYRLCHTQATIKEITYALNFPNPSFFGKYFKAETGISPAAYRTKYAKNPNQQSSATASVNKSYK